MQALCSTSVPQQSRQRSGVEQYIVDSSRIWYDGRDDKWLEELATINQSAPFSTRLLFLLTLECLRKWLDDEKWKITLHHNHHYSAQLHTFIQVAIKYLFIPEISHYCMILYNEKKTLMKPFTILIKYTERTRFALCYYFLSFFMWYFIM